MTLKADQDLDEPSKIGQLELNQNRRISVLVACLQRRSP